MDTYKLFNDRSGQPASVLRNGNISIPFDPANMDAQQFAKWLQEGNRPEPAEEGGVVTDEWIAETIVKLQGNQPLPADEEQK